MTKKYAAFNEFIFTFDTVKAKIRFRAPENT